MSKLTEAVVGDVVKIKCNRGIRWIVLITHVHSDGISGDYRMLGYDGNWSDLNLGGFFDYNDHELSNDPQSLLDAEYENNKKIKNLLTRVVSYIKGKSEEQIETLLSEYELLVK